MPFFKKSGNVEQKIEAINSRILELTKKRESKAKDIQERSLDASRYLGELALNDNPKAEEGLKNARKGLERLAESLSDLDTQIDLLQSQKGNLAVELKQAKLRDLPPMLDENSKAFNSLLVEALKQAEVLKGIHGRMAEIEQQFKLLFDEYNKFCGELGIIQPLELKESFGGPDFGDIRFAMGGFSYFLTNLVAYANAVQGRIAFEKANPNNAKHISDTRIMDFESSKTRGQILPRQF